MLPEYPVTEVIPELKSHLASQSVVILQAPPGAGKSTILPLELRNEPWLRGKKIIMLEPRRLAARSVAGRMSSLLTEEVGSTVGYRVRFENKVSKNTNIEVVTEGILTRMIQTDNSLEDVGLVIFDEFHERSLHADLALALCYQAQQVLRNDLRILIMSATLDGERISALLGNAPIVSSSGRQYPVKLVYEPTESGASLASSMTRVIRKAMKEQAGDILAFLPGTGDIHRVAEYLHSESVGASIHPLYGDLPFKKQQEAITPDPSGARKVVLATSIAETSLTIEGITTVVDCGYVRVPRFDPRSGLSRLETIKVTKDAADQRAGRAGRLSAGVCYRLWSEATNHHLLPHRKPEILEADLTPLMLELANWGVANMSELSWLTLPPAGIVDQAKELLHQLRALENNKITLRGKEMLTLPTHPRMAHMLLEATDKALAADMAALLEERDPLPREAGADLSRRVEILRKWRSGERVNADRSVLERIEKLSASWRRILKLATDNRLPADTEVGKLVMEAYPERIAQQQGRGSERYKLSSGRMAKIPDHDMLASEPWLAIAQMDAGNSEGKIFLAAPLDPTDLASMAVEQEQVAWDKERGMLVGTIEKRIGSTVLSSRPLNKLPEEIRVAKLCKVIQEEGLSILNWEERQKQWQSRVMSLRRWRPDDLWPDVTDAALLETVGQWMAPYLINIYKRAELEKLDLDVILTSILPWELSNRLDVLAPQKLPVPSGSMIPLLYSELGDPPIMEVRLQEVFGLVDTPSVNEGRNKILLHLLSPGYRPVQVTQDLKSFWQTTYHEVRKELRMRYPKHHWPEDPWTAEAVRGVKRNKS